MTTYSVRYVHKVSNRPQDEATLATCDLNDNCFSDSKALAKALRKTGVLMAGARVPEFRVEGNRVVVFPRLPGLTTYWHAVILTRKLTASDIYTALWNDPIYVRLNARKDAMGGRWNRADAYKEPDAARLERIFSRCIQACHRYEAKAFKAAGLPF